MNQKDNLSVDLKRISSFLMAENDSLVDSVLSKAMEMYQDLDVVVGRVSLNQWLQLIKERVGGREKAAERALMASAVLRS